MHYSYDCARHHTEEWPEGLQKDGLEKLYFFSVNFVPYFIIHHTLINRSNR